MSNTIIQAIVHNSDKSRRLTGVTDFRGKAYNIDFIGDTEACYSADILIGSEVETEALKQHLVYGTESSFFAYEYNYCSSVARVIHAKMRKQCGMVGANKDKVERSKNKDEQMFLCELEHYRWNAYMRSIGYIYSGSKEKSSRNDMGKQSL